MENAPLELCSIHSALPDLYLARKDALVGQTQHSGFFGVGVVAFIEVVNEHREKIIDLFIDASYFCTKFSYSFAVIHVVVKMDGLLSLYYRDDSNGMEILLSTNEI